MIDVPDLEAASAQDVLAYAVDRFGAGLRTACSFQKEESVLAHMLAEIAPGARLFTIDTGVLFPETEATGAQFRARFPTLVIDTVDARDPTGAGWTRERCCGGAKVAALATALSGAEAWVTGIRREQGPTRAGARKLERDTARGLWKVNPLADWTDRDVWAYIAAHELPYHPLHDHGYESIGCAPCTLPGSGREGRWSGEEKTECGLHL
ncbi:phosphoadenylyl-sulfate reductase [Conexibacter sp. DBS9H8]|uniref:phosphoadenylyl-sulfate reductase n=1 Tax=Conexibacter sp. DBS9H8 TaxID=2937801 RepID=UPI00200E7139|nr:phosphoadenylyl-sulfate reductase [Conexibacter sp. DBS9H8]